MLRKRKLFRMILIPLIAGLFFGAPPCLESAVDVVIIANPTVLTDYLTKENIRNIYLGITTKWPDKSTIHFATLLPDAANSNLHDEFTRKFVRKTSGQFEMYWRYQMFTGKRRMPPMCKDEAKMVEYVAKHDGAVGYVSSSASLENVKIITVVDK